MITRCSIVVASIPTSERQGVVLASINTDNHRRDDTGVDVSRGNIVNGHLGVEPRSSSLAIDAILIIESSGVCVGRIM